MRLARVGSTEYRSWTTAINAGLAICAAFKIGTCVTSSKRFRSGRGSHDWRVRSPIRSTWTRTNFVPMASLSQRSSKGFEPVRTKLVDGCLKWAGGIHDSWPRLFAFAERPRNRTRCNQERHAVLVRDLGTVTFGPDIRKVLPVARGSEPSAGLS